MKTGALKLPEVKTHSAQPVVTKPQAPYLPAKSDKAPEYTLVLDLDETLMHYNDSNINVTEQSMDDIDEPRYFVRPGLHLFLNELSQHFEMVLFTAAN